MSSVGTFVVDKKEQSNLLFGVIGWHEVASSNVIQVQDIPLLQRAQNDLSLALGTPNDAKNYCKLLLRVVDQAHTSHPNAQKFALFKIEEILGLIIPFDDTILDCVGPKNSVYFVNPDGVNSGPFNRALQSVDVETQTSAANSLACIFTKYESDMNPLLLWLNGNVAASGFSRALPALATLARGVYGRRVLISSDIVPRLQSILRTLGVSGNAQSLYDICYTLWVLSMPSEIFNNTKIPSTSFTQQTMRSFLSCPLIFDLVGLIGAAPSRKIVRMSLAILSNLAQTEDEGILTEMLTSGVLKAIENVQASNIFKSPSVSVSDAPGAGIEGSAPSPESLTSGTGAGTGAGGADPEVHSDLKTLNDVLTRNFRELSSFDRWVSEVRTGLLRAGIVHTERFWKDNVRLIDHDHFKSLKDLINILRTSNNPAVLCIALRDLGEIARFHSNGKGVISSLGGKDLAMTYLDNPDPEVSREALQCVSKILVTNWEFMR